MPKHPDPASAHDPAAGRSDDLRDGPGDIPESPAAGQKAPLARRAANRRFDAEKVARLKAEIAEGRYVVDAFSTADRFIEHERNAS